ncbi:ATP-dependent RNA helicase vasa [Euwallacea similis]|uniref:ATP-dependent RNA helicase vasa n=1 Tax=Euwallacea similis TaxID=1736056 RepID=UPI00344D8AFF
MDEDWDDGTPAVSHPVMSGVKSEGGIKFASGRGFKAVESNGGGDRGWDLNGGGSWGDDQPSASYGGGRSRGRGGRGGRGGGFQRERNNDFGGAERDNAESWGNANEGGDSGGRGRGRGRGGGRGRGRGGGDRNEGRFNRDKDIDDRNGAGDWGGFKGRGGSDEPPKPKEVYVPVERLTDDDLFTTTITSGVNFMKLDEIEVKVTGENIPQPIVSFDSSGLRPHLLENVKKSGYNKPTPIQKYAIPIIKAGRDLMACAQTGSGKTAAFLLPMIHKLLENQQAPTREGSVAYPNVVIVSPTRELAIQIYEQAKKFAYNSIVKTAVAYGGTSVNHQRSVLAAGCHILVATPGRLNDFIEHEHVNLSDIKFFVLDEADRMLDMGFLPTVEKILGHPSMITTGERQTLMFSATFPEDIQHLAGKFLHNYIFVAVGIVGSASTDVEQVFFEVSRFEKRNKLLEMLKSGKERTVVFVETKRNADFLATLLSENDIQSTSIHGDRLQREREQALWDFKKGIRSILVATGVAARGLDIEGIQHVINYDLPKNVDEYVHRIGRTGRVGNRGKATSFYDSSCDRQLAGALSNILKQAGQEVPAFLLGGGCGEGDTSDNFGGRDIRGDDYGRGQNFTQQPAEMVEEEW